MRTNPTLERPPVRAPIPPRKIIGAHGAPYVLLASRRCPGVTPYGARLLAAQPLQVRQQAGGGLLADQTLA